MNKPKLILSPSILSADFANLERDVKTVTDAGAEYIHVDVMDGHFVPNISIGVPVVKSLRAVTDKVLDVHLMISEPNRYAKPFLDAGADIINVHYESNLNFDEVYNLVKSYNKKIAMTINPETEVSVLDPYLDKLDMVLVMSVHPGFGGQKFIESSIDKVRYIRQKCPTLDIEIDGGITLENAEIVIEAGANVLVAGSSVYGSNDVGQTVRDFLNLR